MSGRLERGCEPVDPDSSDRVRVDWSWVRPAEVDTLLADPLKALEKPGGAAEDSFEELASSMVDADLGNQELVSVRGRRRGQGGTR